MNHLIKLFLFFFTLAWPFELYSAVRYNPQIETVQCFTIKKNSREYFFSDGRVYEQNKLLGRTTNGCIVTKKAPRKISLRFYPDKKRSKKDFYTFEVSLSKNNSLYLNTQEPEICFLGREGGRSVYYEIYATGKIYSNGKLLGVADKGCAIYSSKFCEPSRRKTIEYHPDRLTRFNSFFTFRNVDLCQDNSLYINIRDHQKYSYFATSVPYVENVDLKSSYFQILAKRLTKDCNANDRSCQVFAIYRYVVKNFRYIHDTIGITGEDQIIPPLETIKRGGGDCEDLTGVLNSLLSALKVENYVVITSSHAYSLACGINPQQMSELVKQGLLKEHKINKTLTLRGNSYQTSRMKVPNRLRKESIINFTSNSPIDFYLMADISQARNIFNNRPITVVDNCLVKQSTRVKDKKCISNNNSREVNFFFYNPLKKTIKVKVNIVTSYYGFTGASPKLNSLKHQGKDCLLLEATLDDNGYPGFANQKGRKNLAVNPQNWQWFIF